MNFTVIDYTAFAIWIIISFIISYLFVSRFKLFQGEKKAQIALTIGLILGHILYIIWKGFFLSII